MAQQLILVEKERGRRLIQHIYRKSLTIPIDNDDIYCIMDNMNNEKITQLDIEIEACERAIRNAYCVQEVDSLSIRVKELIKQRWVAYNSKGKQ
jgi:hypothetical protein